MLQDHELLQDYVRKASQEAFRELVNRHVDAVYAAARRQLRDPQSADDVTQAVFLILAKKATNIHRRTPLAGWLMKTTFFACRDARKIESRRRHHEQMAAAMNPVHTEQNMTRECRQLSPELDGALSSLNDQDRGAITLRYLEDKSIAEVGAAMGVSPDAAAKRITRAIDRLRARLIRRKAIAPGISLAVVLAQFPRITAPAAVAKSAAAAATSAALSPAGISIAKGAMHMMIQTKIKAATILLGAMVTAGAAGVGTISLIHAAVAPQAQAPAPIAAQPAAALPQLALAVSSTRPASGEHPMGFVARLSNGVSMEILGVSENPSNARPWWLADGSPLEVAPYDKLGAKIRPQSGDVAREMALHVNRALMAGGDEATVSRRIPAAHSASSSTIGSFAGGPAPAHPPIEAEAIGLTDNPNGFTLRAEVAAGKWNSVIKFQPTSSGAAGGSQGQSVYMQTHESDGKSFVTVARSETANEDLRLVAVDTDGVEHVAARHQSSGSATVTLGEYWVDLPIASIQEWRIETRPFDQWMEFRNISLHPDQATQVEIVTSDDAKKK